MASLPKSSPPERRLFEVLEEQQEPFLLDVYLLEYGYSKRILRSKTSVLCWPGGACRRLLRLSSHGLKGRGGFLRSMLNKLVYGKLVQRAISWDSGFHGTGRLSFSDCFFHIGRKSNVLEFERLSCSGNAGVELDGEHQQGYMEESGQLSPISVLDLHSLRGSQDESNMDEEISSTSNLNPEEASQVFEELLKYAYSSLLRCTRTKCEVDLSKTLTMDCVREVEENIQDSGRCLDAEKTEKIIDEQILSWENQKAEIRSISQLIDVDFSSCSKQWSHFQPEIREIGIEVEASIFDEIKAEIVSDMLNSHCTCKGC